MSLEILHFENREDWLKARDGLCGIGGSDAAAACGMSRRKSKIQLWNEKSGRSKAKNLSSLDYVQMGVKTEGPMRELFAALHPEFEIAHAPFDIYHQTDLPWRFATLDGQIRDRETGDLGVLEIKKADCMSRRDFEEWNGKVPTEYFIQVMHQMAATGYDFAYLWALLRHSDGSCTLREYYFPMEDHIEDIQSVTEMESEFVTYLKSGRVPPATLTMP